MAQIGIKLADGSFYTILESEQPRRVRLTLSRAQQTQSHVQLDIIRRDGDEDHPVGTLRLDGLEPEATDLVLVVGVDGDRKLDAQITDPTSEQYQSIAADLDALDEADSWSMPEAPDFDALDDPSGIDSLGEVDELDLPDLDDDDGDDLGTLDLQAALDESDEDLSMPNLAGEAGESDDLDLSMPDLPMPGDDEDDTPPATFDADFDEEDGDFDSIPSPDLDDDDDLSRSDVPGVDLAPDFGEADEPFLDDEDEEEVIEPRPFQPLVLAALILITLSLVALGAFGVFQWLQTDPLPDLRAAFDPGVRLLGGIAI